MENIPYSYFITCDLKNAYFSLPILRSQRKYLRFEWQGQLYQFNCLCFGLSCVPRVFSILMKVIFSYIRKLGISSFYYIDDSLIQADSFSVCKQHSDILSTVLSDLGFYINFEKSNFVPSQRVVYLGHIIDSVAFKVFLTQKKIQNILLSCAEVLHAKSLSIRKVSHLIGLFTLARNAVRLSPLFYRFLNRDKVQALSISNNNFDHEMVLSVESKHEIIWWQDNLILKNGKDIRPCKIDCYIETDASKAGWEGITTGGRWSEDECKLHINLLECKAVYFALLSLCNHLRNTHVCVKTDNSTTVAYLNNQGGSVIPIHLVAKGIWLCCENRNILLTAVHVKGTSNYTADYFSRHFSDSTEWKLDEQVFQKICRSFFIPDIDLFATGLNKQLSKYVSWFPEPDAIASDAFSILWSDFRPYIFSPFSLIDRVLEKIQQDQWTGSHI